MMFKNNDYSLIHFSQLKSADDVVYYLWIFLSLPAVSIGLFAVPLYFILRIRRSLYIVILILVVFAIEYYLYTYLASELDLMNGIYNEVIGLIIFILLFFNHLKATFKKLKTSS